MKQLALVLLGMTAAACHAEPATLGVHETIKNIQSLNGKTVRVVGYLGPCAGYDCGLWGNKEEREAADRLFAAVRAHHQGDPIPPEVERGLPDWLGIGGSPTFDQKAQPFINSYVVITGRVSDKCRDEQLRPGCTDRAPELEPSTISAWTPPKATS